VPLQSHLAVIVAEDARFYKCLRVGEEISGMRSIDQVLGRLAGLLLAGVRLAGVVAVAHPLDDWQRRSPLPTLESLNGIVFGGGQFVAVGSNGEVLTSNEGTNWAHQVSGASEHLVGIAYGNSRFVAISRGLALASSDARTWNTTFLSDTPDADATYGLNLITFLNGVFIGEAGGCVEKHCQGALIGSLDGQTWTRTEAPRIDCVGYRDGTFFATGSTGEIGGSAKSATSTNGIDWTQFVDAASECFGGNGLLQEDALFVTVGWLGSIATSPDGLNWTLHDAGTEASLTSVAHGNGRFVAVGEAIVVSDDGINWRTLDWEVSDPLHGVAYGAGRFVAVGERGTILSSEDGINWGSLRSICQVNPTGVHAAFGNLVVTGNDGMALSADGVVWTPFKRDVAGVRRLAYGENRLVGVTGMVGRGIAWSDGFNWSEQAKGVNWQLSDVIYSTKDPINFVNSFLAVGSSLDNDGSARRAVVLGSPDGQLWTVREVPIPGGLQCLSYGKNMFVATQAQPQPQVWTSPDGVNWVQAGTIRADNIVRLAYGNGAFLACGSDGGSCSGSGHGVIFASQDATSWTPVFDGDCVVSDVAFGAGMFVAISHYGGRGGVYDSITSSDDGIHWQWRATFPQLEFTAASFAHGRFVVIGPGAVVFQSGFVIAAVQKPQLQVERLAGGLLRLVAETPAGLLWIEASDDLRSWRPFATLGVGTAGVPNWFDFDLSGPDTPLQFFRARLVQP